MDGLNLKKEIVVSSSTQEISTVLSSLAVFDASDDCNQLDDTFKLPEESSTNILEALFDYSSDQSKFDKLVQMGQYESKGLSLSNQQQSGSGSVLSSNASPPQQPGSLQIVDNNKPTDRGITSTLIEPAEDDHVSRYTVDDDHDSQIPGTSKKPPVRPYALHTRIGTASNKKPKTRWFSCCSKKKKDAAAKDDEELQLLRSYSGVISPIAETLNNILPQTYLSLDNSGPPNAAASADPVASTSTGAKTDTSASVPVQETKTRPERRTRIPNRPDISMSLWSIIKNAMGKDLTKLPLPVHFNEPLSMLQRLAEDFEYSAVLDKAANSKDTCEQMAYVAAFTVSSYASTALRTGKPFNPLLGETFECDRMDDLGWKCLCEQVSHHPPTAAQHCEGKKWTCWQEFTMSSKFRGNYIEVTPSGIAHLIFTDSGNHYTWRKVSTIVHNLIVGKLWVDQEGDMDIINHKTGDSCHLSYIASNMFRTESKRVEGKIVNKDNEPKFTLLGYWDKKIEAFDVLRVDPKKKLVLGTPILLWSRTMPAPESENYYNFTLLACQLNEMDDSVAPTDSRRRTDQRLMEFGRFDDANNEKVRLEEKQRAARKVLVGIKSSHSNHSTNQKSKTVVLEAVKPSKTVVPDPTIQNGEPGYQVSWFVQQIDSITGKPIHSFKGDYWDCKRTQDWKRCADIYGL